MSPRAAAAAVARGAAATVDAPAPARTRTAPQSAPPRRRSGAGAAVPAAPRYDFVAILDRLLRGPAYIAMVGILLAGIVFFNVDVLELNHGIARTDTRATQLSATTQRSRSSLRSSVRRSGSSALRFSTASFCPSPETCATCARSARTPPVRSAS